MEREELLDAGRGGSFHQSDAPDVPQRGFHLPLGIHALYLNAGRLLPHLEPALFPGHSLASELYLSGGIRCAERRINDAAGIGGRSHASRSVRERYAYES